MFDMSVTRRIKCAWVGYLLAAVFLSAHQFAFGADDHDPHVLTVIASKLPFKPETGFQAAEQEGSLTYYCAWSTKDSKIIIDKTTDSRVAIDTNSLKSPALAWDAKLPFFVEVCDSDRVISKPNDGANFIYVYYNGPNACNAGGNVTPEGVSLELSQSSRKTVFQEGLNQIGKALIAKLGAASDHHACGTQVSSLLYGTNASTTLFKVTLPNKDAPTKEEVDTKSFLTGPEEHWSFSGNAIVTGASQVKYDSTTKTLQESKQPTTIYLSADYQFGDVLSQYKGTRGFDPHNLQLKFLIRPTKSPFNDVGLAVGYRFSNTLDDIFSSNGKTNPSSLGLFFGAFSTKGDGTKNGVACTNCARKTSWRFGLEYNLDQLFSWVGASTGSSDNGSGSSK